MKNIYSKYSPEIDGLRGIAILAVLAFHFFPSRVRGGFVGVDIFFVISGFLITKIILNSMYTEKFNLIYFYSNRVRRIFPALLFILLICTLFGFFLFNQIDYISLGKHLIGGATFLTNVLLIKEIGYFDNAINTKVLAHLWSLGVEEQFYIFFPILLLTLKKFRVNLILSISLLLVVSFLFNIHLIQVDRSTAFYSLNSRMWELMAGALIAAIHINFGGLMEGERSPLSEIISVFGLLAIISAVVVLDQNSVFPGWLALLPVVGAVLMIISSDSYINRKILSSRILVLIGKISYPLYLVHWPLLTIIQLANGGVILSRNLRICLALISIFLAWLIYKYIEYPIRFGKYKKNSHVSLISLSLMFTLLLAGFTIFKNQGYPNRKTYSVHLDEDFMDQSKYPIAQNCLGKFFPKHILSSNYDSPDMCSTNTSDPEVLLVGDSHAGHYYKPLIESDLKIAVIWNGGCYPGARYTESCTRKNEAILKFIQNSPTIKIVLLSSYMNAYLNPKDLAGESHELFENISKKYIKPTKNVKEDYLKFINSINKSMKVKVLYDVPELDMRINANGTCKLMNNCSRVIRKKTILASQINQRVLYSELGFEKTRDFFDPLNYLCDKEFCYSNIGGKLMYRDIEHLNINGARYLSAPLIKWIKNK